MVWLLDGRTSARTHHQVGLQTTSPRDCPAESNAHDGGNKWAVGERYIASGDVEPCNERDIETEM